VARPKRLAIVKGKRVLVEYDSRREEYQEYNQDRWKHQNDLMKFYNSKAWRQLSKLVLNEYYYVCRMCGGDATLADHIIPVRVDSFVGGRKIYIRRKSGEWHPLFLKRG